MVIRLANNLNYTKDGRPYWATFEFGNGCLAGNMRFCPYMDSRIRDNIKVEEVEETCVLKNGEWVGPPPNGIQKWNLRWRGVDPDTGVAVGTTDQYQTDITFEKDDGKLTLTVVFVFHSKIVVFHGVKTGEAKPPKGG
jgi:hypothetical protein